MTSLMLVAVLQSSLLGANPAAPQDFNQALKRAAEANRPVVVLLGATWCPACQVMQKTTLPAVAKAGGLRDVEFAYVDVDRQREVAGQLIRGNSIPQLIRLSKTGEGWQRQYLVGAHDARKVGAFIEGRAAGQPVSLTGFAR